MLLNSDRKEITFLIRTRGQRNHLNAGFHILGLLCQCDWLQCWPLKDCHMSSWVWGAALTIVIYFIAVACMFSIANIHPEFFVIYVAFFVSCNLFVYGCSLSRTPLKMKLLVSKVWFVLVNLNTIENSTISSFKDVQGSTIFWFLYLMIVNLLYWKHLSLASSSTYSVLLKLGWKTSLCHLVYSFSVSGRSSFHVLCFLSWKY